MTGPPGEDVADHGRRPGGRAGPPSPRRGRRRRSGGGRSAAGRRRGPGCAPRGARGRCRRARGRACARPRRAGRSRRRSRVPIGRRRRSAVLIVSIECGASPERMLARLAPSACSSPRPSEWRRSSSSASRGWLVTIAAPRSFSHQRKAGMSSLEPCRRPAWQAPVCEDQSVSQRSQPVRAAAQPGGEGRGAAVAAAPAAGRRGRGRRSRGRGRPGPRSRSPARGGAPGGGRRCGTRSRPRRSPAASRRPR